MFGTREAVERWRWRFTLNPFSRPIVHVAETDDGRLVGHYALVPIPFQRAGERTLAALSIRSMIHPDFQRQGLLKALAARAERQLDEDGIRMGITFLNDNSLHVYTRSLGWSELPGGFTIHCAILNSDTAIRRVLDVKILTRLLGRAIQVVNDRCFPRKDVRAHDVSVRRVQRPDAQSASATTPSSPGRCHWRCA